MSEEQERRDGDDDGPPSRPHGDEPRIREEDEPDGTPQEEPEGPGETGKGPHRKREDGQGGYTDEGTPGSHDPAQRTEAGEGDRDDQDPHRGAPGPARESRPEPRGED